MQQPPSFLWRLEGACSLAMAPRAGIISRTVNEVIRYRQHPGQAILACAQGMRVLLCPQHWLLCHLGLYQLEFEFEWPRWNKRKSRRPQRRASKCPMPVPDSSFGVGNQTARYRQRKKKISGTYSEVLWYFFFRFFVFVRVGCCGIHREFLEIHLGFVCWRFLFKVLADFALREIN